MEEESARVLTGEPTCRGQRGSALVLVLLAIAVLLPSTLVLASLVFRRQQQSLDYRDAIASEYAAHAGLEHARILLRGEEVRLAPGEIRTTSLERSSGGRPEILIRREADVVLSQGGDFVDELAAGRLDMELTGLDADGRRVYRYRRIEIYLVRVDVSRRPTLATVRLYGVIGKLPDGTLETLGMSSNRIFTE